MLQFPIIHDKMTASNRVPSLFSKRKVISVAKSKMIKVHNNKQDFVHAMLYIRVSTDRQAEEGYSIDIQKERLSGYVKSMFGDTKNVEVDYFIDDGYSGGNLDRPEMQRLIQEIKDGQGTHVIVYKLDRLSRSQKDTLYLIEDVFLMHNVAFISMQESFNTATAFGRAVVGILSVFAQLERENIYERTRSGMQKRVESGLWPGGGGVPFGYDYDQTTGILVQNKDAETVKRAYQLFLKGYSTYRIAEMLGLKYDRLAYQILTRKSNAGYIVYNGVEYKGKHEPIISLDTYEQTMLLMRERSKRHIVSETNHLLTGLLRCGKCGAKMRYMKWGKQGYKLMCYSQQTSKKYLIKDENCDNEKFDAAIVEQEVIQYLFKITNENLNRPDSESQEKVEVADILQDRYNDLSKKLKRLYLLFAEENNPILLDAINDVKTEMDSVNQQIADEEQRGLWTRSIKARRESLHNVADTWDYMTDLERREAIRSAIKEIVLTPEHIHIECYI